MSDGTLLKRFTNLNQRHRRGLVYHLGDRGFFAELTTVARSMIYAVAHEYRFLLDSAGFSYGFRHGWSDYFEPVCEEYDTSSSGMDFDHCYSNTRGPGTLFRDVLRFEPDLLELDGLALRGFENILGGFVRAIFRLKEQVLMDVLRRATRQELPESYTAVHIRRGDKVGDEDVYYPPDLYWRKLLELGAGELPLFALSDDYNAVRELRTWLARQGIANRVYTLCEETRSGFSIHAMRRGEACYESGPDATLPDEAEFRQYMHRQALSLLGEVELACRAKAFVGTYESNVSKTIGYLQNKNDRCILMRKSDREARPVNPRVFNDQWKIWIWTNVGRGCDRDGIFKVLLDNGFEYGDIASELGYEPSVDINEIPNPFDEALEDFYPNAERFGSERLELHRVPGFLNAGECEHLIEVMGTALRPSTIVDSDGSDPGFRTGRSCDLGLLNDPQTAEIDIRICRYLGISPSYSESLQGQYYLPGEVFKAHTDWFNEGSEGLNYGGSTTNQRTWTFMIYLNDVEEGGETDFVNVGHAVRPRCGDAVFWNNLYPNGAVNPDVLHCSREFRSGFKAVVTKWFRSHGMGTPRIRNPCAGMPNYTFTGFDKERIPEALFEKLRQYFAQNKDRQSDEMQSLDYLANPGRHPSSMIEISEELRKESGEMLRPVLERWTGTALVPVAVYGLRSYARGTTLARHHDRETHVISAILNIAQDVDRPWPLDIEDHYFRRHEVLLDPGEMLLYESARLSHGRTAPLEGNYYCNLFAHYRPVPAGSEG
jgi:prolyl 4-hydroxylase